MVILWVILEDFRLLFVIEGPYELVNIKVFSPFLAVYEPCILSQLTALGVRNSTYISFAWSTLNFRARKNRSC